MRLLLCLLFALAAAVTAQDEAIEFDPIFSSDGVQTFVDERSTEGSEVLLVQARGTSNDVIVYELILLPGDEGVFAIDSTGNITVGPNGTARLVTANNVQTVIVFEVLAYFSSSGPLGVQALLTVTAVVRDLNDPPYFAPYFTEQAVTISILAETVVGTIISRIAAIDDDLSINGAIIYSLEQLTLIERGSLLTIQQFTGDLIVAQPLIIGDNIELLITATDEGIPALSSTIMVTVRVHPMPPVFDQPFYTASIAEFTGNVPVEVTTIQATVDGSGQIFYGVRTFFPANSDVTFDIDSLSGVLSVNGTLDRETHSRYIVTVKAYEDGYSPDSAAEVSVIVDLMDVNEPPIFLSTHYVTAISEGVGIGAELFSGIRAIDLDDGSNGVLSYSISAIEGLTTLDGTRTSIASPFFIIDSPTGVLTVNTNLEREADTDGFHYYEIIVVASDGGSPSLSSNTVLTVTVIDVNDNPPMFLQSSYSFIIPENEPAGSVVGEFVAMDIDQGAAAQLSFTIVGNFAERFRVDIVSVTMPSIEAQPPVVTTARLISQVELDSEDVGNYSFTIVASDATDVPLSTSVAVDVTVLDRNDNLPLFTSSNFSLEVPEDYFPNNTFIMEFTVTDADQGTNGEVDFSIEFMVPTTFVLVASGTLSTELHLIRPLDRETTDSHSFRIFATDRGNPALFSEAAISITVTDVNDNAPVFQQDTYTAVHQENTPEGTVLTTVVAGDEDIGDNGNFVYSSGNPGQVSVDPGTGVVTLLFSPDYEVSSVFTFEILAIDSGSPQQFGTTNVVLMLIDENDNAPFIENGVFNVSVPENTQIGSEIATLVATDADSGSFGEVTLTFFNGSTLFSLDSATGAVTLVGSLDREQVDQYIFTVLATDGGNPPQSSIGVVEVTVWDVNDNAPQFVGGPYSAEVSEGADGGAGSFVITVLAEDLDIGINAELTYTIAGSGADRFVIDVNGDLTVSSVGVDYEQVFDVPYILTVIATDSGFPQRVAFTTINVTILDGNDNAPVFVGAPYIVTISEEMSGPLVVLTAQAQDLDSGSNGEVAYASLGGSTAPFQFNTTTGEISLPEGVIIDRENSSNPQDESGSAIYTFAIVAMDRGIPPQLSFVMVTILVSDINDNIPMLPMTNISLAISENLAVGSPIFNLVATDADFGSNAELTYTIVLEGAQFGFMTDNFTLDLDPATGLFTLARPIDREQMPAFGMLVQVQDGGAQPNVVNVTVFVEVTDVNDNRPIFINTPYVVNISEIAEIGDSVIAVEAMDLDQLFEQNIVYTILTNTTSMELPFTIDSRSGVITLTESLDRETVPVYQLIIEATDTANNTGLSNFATVTVTVTDINDNPPTFGSSLYTAGILENLPAGTILEVEPSITAFDPDVFQAELSYSLVLSQDSSLFSIDPQTATLRTNTSLNFEANTTFFNLSIIVFDGQFPDIASLQITVLDSNDQVPTFTPNILEFMISESTPINSEVTIVVAEDGDQGENGEVFYFLDEDEPEQQVFAIDILTGALTVNAPLDYERQEAYILLVTGRDGGSPPLESNLTINIFIIDENDNAPDIFNPDPVFNISENSQFGEVVGTVLAVDADTGTNAELQFAIIGGSNGRFAINALTGDITTSDAIDREEQALYELVIEVRDSATFPLVTRTSVTVVVNDVNDVEPTFPNSPLEITITEETTADSQVFVFNAVDSDEGTNSELTYTIVSQEPEQDFYIDVLTGALFANITLDRETTPEYILTVMASDGGDPSLSANGTILITLSDVNDNVPTFTVVTFNAQIMENPPNGSLVRMVEASDADIGNNASLLFSIISGNAQDSFRIDPTSGIVTVEDSDLLDFETTQTFFLQLQVQDMGMPPLSSQAALLVTLTDVNDNAPVFPVGTPDTTTVVEDTMAGTIVAVLSAEDADQGSNAAISYAITQGNSEGIFDISNDGAIVVAGGLDFETSSSYELVIEAIDNGLPPLSGSTNFTVLVTDVNDNYPSLENEPDEIFVLESAVLNEVIANITAVDPDSGNNGLIIYRIVNEGSNQPFFINDFTGSLSLVETLDRETVPQYFLVIEATDNGSPPLAVQKQFTIMVLDVDDNLPQFTRAPAFSISESQTPSQAFAIVTTTDADLETNRAVFYFIIGGQAVDVLQIESESGQVSLSRQVDFDAGEQRLVVQLAAVTENKNPGGTCTDLICTTTTLTVTIVDINDNAPALQDEYDFSVNETLAVDSIVGVITSTDADTGDFAIVQYELLQTLKFSVEQDTGVVSLGEAFNSTIDLKYNRFQVLAFDNLRNMPSFSSTATVRVYFVSEGDLVVVTVFEGINEVMDKLDELKNVLKQVPVIGVFVYDLREFIVEIEPTMTRQTTSSVRTNITLLGVEHDSQMVLLQGDLIGIIENNVDLLADIVTVDTITLQTIPMEPEPPFDLLIILYIVIGALGGLVLFILFILLLTCCCLRSKRKKKFIPGTLERKQNRPISSDSTLSGYSTTDKLIYHNPQYINPYSNWSEQAEAEEAQYRERSVDEPVELENVRDSVLYESKEFVMADFNEASEDSADEEARVEIKPEAASFSPEHDKAALLRGEKKRSRDERGIPSVKAVLDISALQDEEEEDDEDEDDEEDSEEEEGTTASSDSEEDEEEYGSQESFPAVMEEEEEDPANNPLLF